MVSKDQDYMTDDTGVLSEECLKFGHCLDMDLVLILHLNLDLSVNHGVCLQYTAEFRAPSITGVSINL